MPTGVQLVGVMGGWPIGVHDREMSTRGTVRSWDPQSRSWVVDSPQTPGGCWLPSSAVVEGKGASEFGVGDLIDFEWEHSTAEVSQGLRYRATQAWPQRQMPRNPRWRLHLEVDEPTDAPEHFVDACRAVGRDTRCFSEFDDYRSLVWTIEDTTNEFPAWTIGLNAIPTVAGGGDIPSGFGFGIPYETDVAIATAEIAEAVQDWLSGYEFVLWPVSSVSPLRLFKPVVRDGRAVWIDRADDSVTCLIGELCTWRGAARGT